jgi:cyclophilin family peptidyl-prolyl cis-trans isomerase
MRNAQRRGRRDRRRQFLTADQNQGSYHRPVIRRFEPLEHRMMLHGDQFDNFSDDDTVPALVDTGIPFAAETLAEGESANAAEGESSGPANLTEFAQQLTDEGVRFFGAFWCPHCNRQKALFGAGEDALPFIKVTEGDPAVLGSVVLNAVGRGEDLTLNPTGRAVNSFPTWEFQDGSRVEGYQTLQSLSELSGIPLPPNVIAFDTNFVDFEIELLPDAAPGTVANFLKYINDGDFINSVFHRFVPGFVIQAGGFTSATPTFFSAAQFSNVPTDAPIQNEFNQPNLVGTISMAKLGGDPNSATSQFFINFGDNSGNLDNQNGGFTVFARLLDIEVVDEIAQVSTVNAGGAFTDLPLAGPNSELILIEAIRGSGTINGIQFDDLDADGVQDTDEDGLQGFTIYSDANGNGQLDADETSAVTSADGSYSLLLDGGMTHTIREVPVNGFAQTLPTDPEFYSIDLDIGANITADFGNIQIAAPLSIDLAESTDSGISDSDDLTNFNNSAPELAPIIQLTDVEQGGRVRIRADGIVVAEQVATDSDVSIALDGVTTLNEGSVLIGATQEVNGVEGPGVSLFITVDRTAPPITSTPPTQATVDESFVYNAESSDEGQAGFSYSLTEALTGAPVDPSIGIAINPTSGTVAWTPDVTDIGDHAFSVVATDAAGNRSVQALDVEVSREKLVRIRLDVADLNGDLITEVDTGDRFQLLVFVQDLRADAGGVFSAYNDITVDSDLVTAIDINHGASYGQGGVPNKLLTPPQTVADVLTEPGLLDEVGSFSASLAPLGGSERELLLIEFEATGSGVIQFMSNQADQGAVHEIGLYNRNGPVPNDQVDYGDVSLSINSNIIVLNPTFGPDEDSPPTTVPLLSLVGFKDGATGTLTITEVGSTPNGIVNLAQNGLSLSYQPNADFVGPDEFTYTVSDGTDVAKGTVTLAVQPVNDPPVAVDDSFEDPTSGSTYVIPEDNPNNFLPVLGNDNSGPDDPTTETLSVDTVDPISAQDGTVVRASIGLGILYTPASNFIGRDTFTYSIRDTQGAVSTTATVTVNVVELNDPPTANDDSFPAAGTIILEDSTDIELNVLANDSTAPDVGEVLTITGASTPASGGVVTLINNATALQYSPAANFFGQDTFTYTVTDGNGGTDTASVTVTVTGTNDPPTANDDSGASFRVTQNSSNNILDLLANDSIAPDEGETLTITGVSNVSTGATVTISNDSMSVVYSPATDSLGDDTFTYTIDDGNGGTDTATVTVDVVEFIPGSLSGLVYIDSNNDGQVQPGERGLAGVTITLTGTDAFGDVNRNEVTDSTGAYSFGGLAPGSYSILQTQPGEDFENDNIPIIDGIDSIGSQGGEVTANDQFTITLAEGVDGTDNNFAEVKGRSLTGGVFHNLARAGNVRFVGLETQLFDADAATGTVFRDTNTTPLGQYAFLGLPPAEYTVAIPTQDFLVLPVSSLKATVAAADSTDNNFDTARSADSLSYRDFVAARSLQALHAAAQPGEPAQRWYSIDTGWDGVSDVVISLAADRSSLTLQLTENGQRMGATLSIPDSQGRVRLLSHRADGSTLIRFDGNRGNYDADLTVIESTNGAAAGEGEFAAAAVPVTLAQPAITRVVSATSAAPLLSQPVNTATASVFDSAPSGAPIAPTSDPGEGEFVLPLLTTGDSDSTLTTSSDSGVSTTIVDRGPLVDAVLANVDEGSDVEIDHVLNSSADEEDLLQAVDLVMAEDSLFTDLL